MGQEIKTPKKRTIAKMPLHVYLGYLLILTLIFTTVSFAKFATAGDAADTARVASFSVSAAVGDDDSKAVDFNDAASKFGTTKSVSYDINVTNKENGKISEVAVGYRVIVSYNASDLTPAALSLSIDGNELSPVLSDGKYTYTYIAADPLPAGTETAVTHSLTVAVNSLNILNDYEDIPISVSVSFEQID